MRQVKILIKNNGKLLFRNKAFLFFLFVLPVLSLFILNLKDGSLLKDEEDNERRIHELQSADDQVIYLADSYSYTVKVFDSSESELTDYVLDQLNNTGMFEIYRYRSGGMTEAEIMKKANENVQRDRIGCILYVGPGFTEAVLSGSPNDSVTVYRSSEDERKALFEDSLRQSLSVLLAHSETAQGDVQRLLTSLQSETAKIPQKKVQQISSEDVNSLTYEQKQQESRIGYSYAILTLSFLFCGIFVAYTVIEERDNRIYIRFTLSNTGVCPYIVSKLAISLLISLAQTVIIGIGLLIIRPDVGIGIMNYLFLVFLMGTIFNTLSLCLGVALGNVMGANYAAYTIWIFSCILSGLYFSLEHSSEMLKKISYFMPQKWFLKAAEMIMTGDNSAYLMVVGITMAFLVFILSMGAAGLKLKDEV